MNAHYYYPNSRSPNSEKNMSNRILIVGYEVCSQKVCLKAKEYCRCKQRLSNHCQILSYWFICFVVAEVHCMRSLDSLYFFLSQIIRGCSGSIHFSIPFCFTALAKAVSLLWTILGMSHGTIVNVLDHLK